MAGRADSNGDGDDDGFGFRSFFAYFYGLVLRYPPPHLRPTGTHFFILETEIYTYIRSCASRIDIDTHDSRYANPVGSDYSE